MKIQTLILSFLFSIFLGCQSKKSNFILNNEEMKLVKSLEIPEDLAEEVKLFSRNNLSLLPEIDEFGDFAGTKTNGIATPINTKEFDPYLEFDFIQKNKSRFQKENLNIFIYSDANFENHLGVVKGLSDFEILEWRRTNGINYGIETRDILEKLQKLKVESDFILVGCGFDWLQIKFTGKRPDFEKLAQEVYEFSPDIVDQGIGDVKLLPESLKELDGVFLWWD